ncbi:MAG: CCA tRNA nucleotidyltransferase [Patescibacteria group bacterium]|jgi:tRNA nucleotidyltransferase (CCA-adding enzyme)|nr:CCA tRNA nucleotidyltransferase [Patescibacteria group bacterium]
MEIPEYIKEITEKLKASNFEAYLVGGSVRDLLMGKDPYDFDITTNAMPDEIMKVFENGKYENDFGTVILPIKEDDKLISVVEITTYRSEKGYSDNRHPDEVKFETSIEKDLERRDFTVNSLAMDVQTGEIIDLFGGQKDIKKKIIRAVGEPEIRFKEDALRMMRAIRFISQLKFELEPKTQRSITKLAGSIKFVSKERIRDELIKILKSEKVYEGIILLHETKLLNYIIPEIEQGVGVKQDRHHIYTVFKHNVLSLKNCPSKDWQVKLAALLHDVGKPKTKKKINGIYTFYNHEYASARMTNKILSRLRFKNEDRERIVNLVRNHMFYYNVGEVSAASVRRLIVKVGKENLKDLIDLRIADRLGSGVPKAMPYKLRHLQYMLEKVQNDPVSVKMLKINGNDLMNELNIEPGPKVGAILDVLLSEVIEDPENNNKEYLLNKASKLMKRNLEELREDAKEKIEEKKVKEDESIKKQFRVN